MEKMIAIFVIGFLLLMLIAFIAAWISVKVKFHKVRKDFYNNLKTGAKTREEQPIEQQD